jgi:protein phosphatase
MLRFHHATLASQGARRYQEDAAAVWSGGEKRADSTVDDGLALIAVLADGMGGHTGGALASRTICTTFLNVIALGDGLVPARLEAALSAANGAVAERVAENAELAGMGATLVGVAFSANGVEWVSVGDSPLYLIRRGEIARLNEDHSLAPMLDRMVAEGSLSAEQAKNDPRRHYLRAAVSGEELDLIDISRRPLVLEADDTILIASDGIHTLDDEAIARLVTEHLPEGPDATAAALIRSVDRTGDDFQDNTTVVVIAVEDVRSV